jgi:hypothetical protein
VEERALVDTLRPMTSEQAEMLKRLAKAAYELDAFKPNLTRAEADRRIAASAAKLKLLGEPPHTSENVESAHDRCEDRGRDRHRHHAARQGECPRHRYWLWQSQKSACHLPPASATLPNLLRSRLAVISGLAVTSGCRTF